MLTFDAMECLPYGLSTHVCRVGEELHNLWTGTRIACPPGPPSEQWLARARDLHILAGTSPPCAFLEQLNCHLFEVTGEADVRVALSLLEEATSFLAAAWQDDPALVRALFAPTRKLLTGPWLEFQGSVPARDRDGSSPPQGLHFLPADPVVAKDCFEQMPCMPVSAYRRACRIRQERPGRVLLLGDDDLVSLHVPGAEVLEIDPDVVERLRGLGVSVTLWDIAPGLPAGFPASFDLVVLDPPWARQGMATFLARAREALRPQGRILLCTNLDFLEGNLDFPGFRLLERIESFSSYPYPDALRQQLRERTSRFDLPLEMLTRAPYVFSDLFVCEKIA